MHWNQIRISVWILIRFAAWIWIRTYESGTVSGSALPNVSGSGSASPKIAGNRIRIKRMRIRNTATNNLLNRYRTWRRWPAAGGGRPWPGPWPRDPASVGQQWQPVHRRGARPSPGSIPGHILNVALYLPTIRWSDQQCCGSEIIFLRIRIRLFRKFRFRIRIRPNFQ